jgi:hypothetical protein
MPKHWLLVPDPNAPSPDRRPRVLSDHDEREELKQGDVVAARGARWVVTAFETRPTREGGLRTSAYVVEPFRES